MMQRIPSRKKGERGYILLLAVLISSIILAISLGVYSIGLKQFLLSSFLSESQKALVAADRGIECFMYWDGVFRTNSLEAPFSIFPQDNTTGFPPDANEAFCSGNQLGINGVNGWSISYGAIPPSATTLFSLNFSDSSCVNMRIYRDDNETRITADGYNTCNVNNMRRTQRTIEVTASI